MINHTYIKYYNYKSSSTIIDAWSCHWYIITFFIYNYYFPAGWQAGFCEWERRKGEDLFQIQIATFGHTCFFNLYFCLTSNDYNNSSSIILVAVAVIHSCRHSAGWARISWPTGPPRTSPGSGRTNHSACTWTTGTPSVLYKINRNCAFLKMYTLTTKCL